MYAQAGTFLQSSLDLLKACQEGGSVDRADCRLVPEAIQSQAYGLAKQVELTPSPSAEQIAAVSRKSDEAMAALRRLEVAVPPHYRLTVVRVHLLRGEGREAAEQLRQLRAATTREADWSQWSRAEWNLLLAAAQRCCGDAVGGEVSLATYRQLAGSLPNPERAQYREIQELPRLTRQCTATPTTRE